MVTYLTSNNDILAIIPTDGGKSVCYWTAGLVSSGVTVVITPLIALMNDQVSKLQNCGIRVCFINFSMLPEQRDSIFHELTQDDTQFKFFYLTPEVALSQTATSCFEKITRHGSLARFIIDEAHCVDTWGHNFRPSYGELYKLKQFNKPIAAFTGTATHQTMERIIEKLELNNPVTIQSTSNRANLFYRVVPKSGLHPKEDLV